MTISHAHTKHQIVEQPAIGLFAALGWQTLSAIEETCGAGGTGDLLRPRLRSGRIDVEAIDHA
ncbi:MAG TPA: hypothetical protein PK440_15620 [Candidatus Accumulibacter phosphatis]|nr:hypothetical protein [Candidatus Accumulibacter phosphatis]